MKMIKHLQIISIVDDKKNCSRRGPLHTKIMPKSVNDDNYTLSISKLL